MERLPSMQTLRAFEAAARHGSYSQAADELSLTHGAISHRIRELEDRLQVRLFRRVGRGMAPTREAVTLLAQVRQALGALHLAFPERTKKGESRLVVSVHPALATCWLIPRLSAFTLAFPKIAVQIHSTADVGDFLAPGIDVAIRYGTGAWPNVVAERLAGEILFPVCTPEYRDNHKLKRPADLVRCTLLRHVWQPWSPWLQAAKLQLREATNALTLSDSSMLLEAAACGQGVALARGLFAQDALSSGRLVRLFNLEVADLYSYYVVWRAGTTLTAQAVAFRDWVQGQFVLAAPAAGVPDGSLR
jgi:LysR family glycine cleavage system transcriptional activator